MLSALPRSAQPGPLLRRASALLTATLLMALAPTAWARDRNAGPIYSHGEAQQRCPVVCGPDMAWNGQWRTTQPGAMSVCGCTPLSHARLPDRPPVLEMQPPAGLQVVVVRRAHGPRAVAVRCSRACAAAHHGAFTGRTLAPSPAGETHCLCAASVAAPPSPTPPAARRFEIPTTRLGHPQQAARVCYGVCTAHGATYSGLWRNLPGRRVGLCGCLAVAPPPPDPLSQTTAPPPEALPGAPDRGHGAGAGAEDGPPPAGPSTEPQPQRVPMRPPSAQAPPPPQPELPPAGHDGCRAQGQACTCGNTGWAGACNVGPHKQGLYCRCD